MNRFALLALISLILLSSANAFVLTTTLQPYEVEPGEMHVALDAARASNSKIEFDDYPLDGRSIAINVIDEQGDAVNRNAAGNMVVTLDGIEPTTFKADGTCSDRCCENGSGPKVTLSVKTPEGDWVYPSRPGQKIYYKTVYQDYIECARSGSTNEAFITDLGSIRITKIEAPEFHGVNLPGTYSPSYIVPDGESPQVRVEFCIVFTLANGLSSECISDLSELENPQNPFRPDEPVVGGEGSVTGIVDRIAGNTDETTETVDDKINNTQGTIFEPSSIDLGRCDNEFNTVEQNLFIAKTRFDYGRIGLNYSGDHASWGAGLRDKWKGTEIDLSAFRGEQEAYFSFFLDTFTPKLVTQNESGTVIEPKFHSAATTEPVTEMLKTWTGKQLNCGTGEKALNQEGTCTASRIGNDDRIIYRIYNYEAPYFRQASAQEKQDYGRDEILVEGPHCYDVWAYYEFKLDLADGEESWWITSKEELERFEQAREDGWNLRITTVSTSGVGLQGVNVSVAGTVHGEEWSAEGTTNSNGIVEFIAPENVDLSVEASKELYRTSETTVNFEGQHEETILMHGSSYTMPLVFSRDDFWFLYFKVRPQFLEPKEAIGSFNIPEERNARKAALDKSQFVIDEDESNRLYEIASEFYWWQEQPCDEGDSTRLEMAISDDFRSMTKTDYLGLPNKVYDVMLIQGMKYDSSYYSCGLVPKGGETVIREVAWNVDHEGNISPQGKRDI